MNTQELLQTARNLGALVAAANPASAGSVTVALATATFLEKIIMPLVQKAKDQGELTPEEEQEDFFDAEAFWASVRDGSLFSGSHWQLAPINK